MFVRRGGPNYQEGLKVMRNCGDMLGVPLHVFGPETHMTSIVGMALGSTPIPDLNIDVASGVKDNFLFGKVRSQSPFLSCYDSQKMLY